MALTSQELIVLAGNISAMQTLINQTQNTCNQLRAANTTLSNNANLLEQYPTDGPAVLTWLTNTDATLTSFLNSLSNPPSLNN